MCGLGRFGDISCWRMGLLREMGDGGVPLAVAVPRVPAAGKKKKIKVVADESLFFSTLWLGGGGAAAPVPPCRRRFPPCQIQTSPPALPSPQQPPEGSARRQQDLLRAHRAPIWDANVTAESLGSLGTRGRARRPPLPCAGHCLCPWRGSPKSKGGSSRMLPLQRGARWSRAGRAQWG